MLSHKACLAKFKQIKILSSIFSDHNTMRLEVNHKGKKKNINTRRQNSMVLNNNRPPKRAKRK